MFQRVLSIYKEFLFRFQGFLFPIPGIISLQHTYYNFLRPHRHNRFQVLNKDPDIELAGSMPGKWQIMIYLGQKAILEQQKAAQA